MRDPASAWPHRTAGSPPDAKRFGGAVLLARRGAPAPLGSTAVDTERYALLLRGVNVGGVKLPMAPLRTALADAGYANVATYIQSGNIV
ncbi:MAG: DUF1697 domain-containing protein, partial [Acidimicrobiia bacterium]